MTTLDLAQIQIRRDTAANWTLANPILASSEAGFETDTHLLKRGDGTTAWNTLTYQSEQIAAQIHLATSKALPVDADEIPLADSAATFGLKKLTWANLKATLKTYFDPIYARFNGATVNAKTASYTLVAADVGTRITMNAAGATAITVNTSLFAAGDTLIITNIGAGACTITAGTATVSTASSLVLAQYDSGRLYFTSTGVAIWEKFQGAAASGKVLQVVQGTTTTSTTLGGNTYTDTTLTATITPSATTSKILVLVMQGGCIKNSGAAGSAVSLRLLRGATAIADVYSNLLTNTAIWNGNTIAMNYLDSPSTTSATTYKTQFSNPANISYIGVQDSSSLSTILLIEIGA